jgi:hypothetical protein
MIKFYHIRIISGAALMLCGVLALLQTSGFVQIPESTYGLIFAAMFGALGVLFLGMIPNQPEQWWAVFPGAVLVAIAAVITLGVFFSPFAWLGGALFLGILGLAFIWVYLTNPTHWWALIPGGTLLTLGIVSLGDRFPLFDSATLLFLGLAATFGLVYFLPTGGRRMSWAWIPAVSLLGMAAFISFFTNHNSAYLWPLILIGIGIFLAVRSFKPKNESIQ